MTDPRAGLQIWKHSHGTTKTSGWSDDEREEFKADSILTVGDGLEWLQIENFKQMRRGMVGRCKTGTVRTRRSHLKAFGHALCWQP